MITEDIKRINELISLTEEDNIGNYIDSTYLKTPEQAVIDEEETETIIFNTVSDAIENNFKLVMIRPEYVLTAREIIDKASSNVLVGTVIGFPNGDGWMGDKFDEAMEAIKNGVDELDYVVNYKAFQKGDLDTIWKEIGRASCRERV